MAVPDGGRCARAALAALGAAAVFACGRGPVPGRAGGRRVAAATIAALSDIVSRVAGSGWDVRTIVPPGTSPHVFEPTPREVRRIAPAELIVTVGAGYDGWAAGLAAACASRAVIHDAGGSVGIHVAGGNSDHEHGDEEGDPHWWLSPPLARRALDPLAARFASLDPAGARGYADRAAAFGAELDRLDDEIRRVLAPVLGKGVLAAHNAWTYFAAAYGLRAVGAIEPVPGREPSPKELGALIRRARGEGSRSLFTEPQFPAAAARVVAEDAGLRVQLVDPIGGVPGRATYIEMMRFNAAAFRRGLS